jgi:7,8-dihydropterin-6-yl-methyl-4-(beta-D-ribofuranosyl)aminobenzene 5'-phosphate synthase
MDAIAERGPRVVALSGHDSTPWADREFASRFGGAYRLLRAGQELRITAAGATPAASTETTAPGAAT